MNKGKAFICYSHEDKDIVSRLANELNSQGVDIWLDRWEMSPGDSLVRKIDEGIEGARFFLAVLSPCSLQSEWVRTELDAAMVKKIENACRLIPVFFGLDVKQLPPTLRSIIGVSLDDFDAGVSQIVNVYHGLSQKPQLGPAPQVKRVLGTGLSSNAVSIAMWLAESDGFGAEGFVMHQFAEIQEATGLEYSVAEEALDELEEAVMVELIRSMNEPPLVKPRNRLFWELDPHVKGWNPEQDAKSLAATAVNMQKDIIDLDELAGVLEWSPRRTNPAAAYLVEYCIAKGSLTTSAVPYAYNWLQVTPKTRRFARGM